MGHSGQLPGNERIQLPMSGEEATASILGKVSCPRCGYDQQGSVAAWGEVSCPIEGTCSECGLRFEWGDLINPYRQRCVGLYEHAKGWRDSIRWFCRTLAWMAWPGVYWSRVQMHHVVMTKRLVWTVLLGMIGLHLLAAGVHAAGASFAAPWWLGPWYVISGWKGAVVYFHALMQPFAGVDWYASRYTFGSYVAGISPWIRMAVMMVTGLAIWPIMFAVLPVTRRLASVRWAHIARAAWTPGLFLIMLLALRAVWYILGVAYAGVYTLVGPGAGANSLPDPETDPLFARLTSTWAEGLEWACVLFLAWLVAWWGFAIVRGWRISQGWLVFGLLALTMLIGVVALGLLVNYSILWN
jgi:hypothetical protein